MRVAGDFPITALYVAQPAVGLERRTWALV
jgi:hypothetical protein